MTERQPDERWDAVLGMLESIASLDFSRSLAISGKADELDAVASGLNMLSEELEASVVERAKLEAVVTELEAANRDLDAFSDSLASVVFDSLSAPSTALIAGDIRELLWI